MPYRDVSVYRTYDEGLRQARYDQLTTVARAVADAFSEDERAEILVTGSVSRGQCHPWSDLDLLLRAKTDDRVQMRNMRHDVICSAEENGLSHVDVIVEERIIDALKTGIIGSARRVDALPSLQPLPDPDLAIVRSAVSLEMELDRFRKSLESSRAIIEGEDADDHREIELWAANAGRIRLAYRVRLALRRLAVFQDGGRALFLDSEFTTDVEDLRGLLERLSEPATMPYARPAVLPSSAAVNLIRLLTVDDECDPGDVLSDLEALMPVIEDWVSMLRSATDLRETHGLDQSSLMPSAR